MDINASLVVCVKYLNVAAHMAAELVFFFLKFAFVACMCSRVTLVGHFGDPVQL